MEENILRKEKEAVYRTKAENAMRNVNNWTGSRVWGWRRWVMMISSVFFAHS